MTSRKDAEQEREWPIVAELLAQVVEEVSVVATERHRRQEPRKIPRPDFLGSTGSTEVDRTRATRKGIAVLAATRRRG